MKQRAIKDLLDKKAQAEQFYDMGFDLAITFNHKEAIKYYTKAIELDPTSPKYYKFRAISLALIGKGDEAIKDFTMAIKLNPQDGDAYRLRAVEYEKKGEKEKAAKDREMAENYGVMATKYKNN